MSLINDYSYQVMTDERERDIARLVKHNHHVRAALNGRVSWLRRLQAIARSGSALRPSTRHDVEWRRPSTGSRTKRDPVRRQSQVAR